MQLNGRENEIYEQYVATLCFSQSVFVWTMQREWDCIWLYKYSGNILYSITVKIERRKYEVLKNISISIKLYALCFESFQSLREWIFLKILSCMKMENFWDGKSFVFIMNYELRTFVKIFFFGKKFEWEKCGYFLAGI